MGRGRGLLDFDMGDPFKPAASGEGSFLSSPAAQGLLGALFGGAAAARRGAPWNTLGAAGLSGLHGYNVGQKGAADLKQQQLEQNIMRGFMGDAPNVGGQSMSNGQGPTVGNMQNLQTLQTQQPDPTQQQLQYAKAMTMINPAKANAMLNNIKFVSDGVKRESGATYINPATGAVTYMPKIGENQDYNPSTRTVRPVSGALETIAALTGAQKTAEERAKARYTPLPTNFTSGGVPVGGSVASYLDGGWGGVNQQYANGQPERNNERLRYLQEELATEQAKPNQNPTNIAALQREIARASPASQIPRLDSAAEQAAQKVAAEKGAENARAAEQRYGQMSAGIGQARQLLKSGATGSGAGALYDSAAGFFGASPKGANEARQLETLAAWMTMNTPRMEGPQSDKDSLLYRQMAALVGDRTVPNEQRLKAVDTLESLQDKYRHLNVPAEMRMPGVKTETQQPTQQQGVVMSKSGKPMVQVNGQWHYVTGATGGW